MLLDWIGESSVTDVITVTRGEETHAVSSYAEASVEECDNEYHTQTHSDTQTHTQLKITIDLT